MIVKNTSYRCPEGLKLYIAEGADPEKGQAIAAQLNIPVTSQAPDCKNPELMLVYDEKGLSLVKGSLSMQGDFTTTKNLSRIKQGVVQKEMLVKASKLKNHDGVKRAIDATAGMGEDSLLLAAAGFEVELYEYDLVIAALLQDTLDRCAKHPVLGPIVARMHLTAGNSIELLNAFVKTENESADEMGNQTQAPDVILLDPMFPERTKSAMIKKKFQLLQQLERPCNNEQELLDAAMKVRPRKLVIKRPLKGPYLAERKPDYSISGKAIRYDCFVYARD